MLPKEDQNSPEAPTEARGKRMIPQEPSTMQRPYYVEEEEQTIPRGQSKPQQKRTVIDATRPLSYDETPYNEAILSHNDLQQTDPDSDTIVSTSRNRIKAVVPPQEQISGAKTTPSFQALPQVPQEALPSIPQEDPTKTEPHGQNIMEGIYKEPQPTANLQAQTPLDETRPHPQAPLESGPETLHSKPSQTDTNTDPTGFSMDAGFSMSPPTGASTIATGSPIRPLPRPKLDEGFVFASKAKIPALWRRISAGLVDLGLLLVLALFVTLLFGPGSKRPFPQGLQGLDFLATFLNRYNAHIFFFFIAYSAVYTIYATATHKLLGATLGKLLFGMKVVDRTGATLSWIGSLSRSLAHVLFFLLALVGVSWIFVDRESRGIHDRIAGSLVVRR